MKRTSLLAAAAIVLVANAFALAHAWRNRSGAVTADITLTERELPLAYNSDDDDSGVAFNLRWTDPQGFIYAAYDPSPWLDQNHLQELGFDISLAPSDQRCVSTTICANAHGAGSSLLSTTGLRGRSGSMMWRLEPRNSRWRLPT